MGVCDKQGPSLLPSEVSLSEQVCESRERSVLEVFGDDAERSAIFWRAWDRKLSKELDILSHKRGLSPG